MRLFTSLFLAFLFGAVGAQVLNNPNKLPLCADGKTAWVSQETLPWHNCWGAYKSSGASYVGEFKDGLYHGLGTYIQGDLKYVGEFKGGNRHGQGTQNNGQYYKYVGEQKDGRFDGQGTLTDYRGTYVGEFKDHDRHGMGIFTSTRGNISEGEWKFDKFVRVARVDPPSPPNSVVPENNLTNADSDRRQLAEDQRRLEEKKRQAKSVIESDDIQTENSNSDNRRRFALVIGNSNYNSLPKLPNAINDARVITQSLRSTGFQVSTHENLDLVGMQNAVRAFGEKLGKNDVGLVYYAGHGVQVKGKNYLIPVRENIKKSFEVPSSAIDVDLVLATLEHIKNDLNIVVLDACRSSFPGEARGTGRGLATIEAAKGTFIAFATAPGKEALDGSGSNSPYTKHLAKLIGKKGLPLEQVFKEVRKAVVAETNGEQVPWENSSLMGDFYFVK